MLQRLEGIPRRFIDWSMHLPDSVAGVDEIEQLFADSPLDAPEAVTNLLEAITGDARWHRGDDVSC